MNTTTSKFSSAWDDSKMINTMKQHEILYSYNLHKRNLDHIKINPNLKMVDNEEPVTFKLIPSAFNTLSSFPSRAKSSKMNQLVHLSKQQKEKELVIYMENGSLINRMKEISEKGSQYNKQTIKQQSFKGEASLNAPQRRKECFQVNTENLSLHNRLDRVQSTINFGSYDKQYSKARDYKNNLTRSSRRIFNCFVKTEANQELIASNKSQAPVKISKDPPKKVKKTKKAKKMKTEGQEPLEQGKVTKANEEQGQQDNLLPVQAQNKNENDQITQQENNEKAEGDQYLENGEIGQQPQQENENQQEDQSQKKENQEKVESNETHQNKSEDDSQKKLEQSKEQIEEQKNNSNS